MTYGFMSAIKNILMDENLKLCMSDKFDTDRIAVTHNMCTVVSNNKKL
jgi:hypothetical protein